MYRSNSCVLLLFFVIQSLLTGCHHSMEEDALYRGECGYSIQVPEGWHEVPYQEDVKKHVFWGFSSYNETRHLDLPLFRAWDAPENANAFLTVMEVRRHRNLGMGGFYNQTIPMLRDMGWNIQEQGVTEVDHERCKWWIQTHAGGAVQQKCYMVAMGPYLYIFTFTTSFLSEEREKLFHKIMNSVTFNKGL